MKIVKPTVELMSPVDGDAVLRHIERCGRVCYKSEEKITADSAKDFVRKRILENGHESVLEHFSFSVRIICDRGVTHEIVRHRLASYSQESTRYCNYGKTGEVSFVEPMFRVPYESKLWDESMQHAEEAYLSYIRHGASPQMARNLLPNSLKTEIIMTANLREWRHFFKLRTSPKAHPQMRQIAIPLLLHMQKTIPVVFEDILVDTVAGMKLAEVLI